MYMVVFVTLMVALIGLYAEIYTKQAASMYNQQTGVADTMLNWHATAVSLASYMVTTGSIPPSSIPPIPCSLNNSGMPAGIAPCKYGGGNVYVGMPDPAGTNECTPGVFSGCWTPLPNGFLSPPYSFYSIFFQYKPAVAGAVTQYYVMTYVPPPPSTGDNYNIGLLCLPGDAMGTLVSCSPNPPQTQISTSYNSFYKQMIRNPRTSAISFGTILTAGTLTTPTISILNLDNTTTPASVTNSAGSYTFTVPTVGIPLNSIGIISQISPCVSC